MRENNLAKGGLKKQIKRTGYYYKKITDKMERTDSIEQIKEGKIYRTLTDHK